jgi:Ulp1 family protease
MLAFSTFFWVKLNQDSQGNTATDAYTFKNVASERWTHHVDIFECEAVFVPVNKVHIHWWMAVIHPQRRMIVVVNSAPNAADDGHVCQWLLRYVNDEHKRRHGVSLGTTWATHVIPSPPQRNGYDCGVFTLLAADCLALREALVYAQDDMPIARKWIALQSIRGMLFP